MTNHLHKSQYMTNSNNLNDVVGYKILHFINNEDQEALCYKILWCTNTVTSDREKKNLLVSIFVC